jgi:hypothetical protein
MKQGTNLIILVGPYYDLNSPHSFFMVSRENSKKPLSNDGLGADGLDWPMLDSFIPLENATWPSNDSTILQFSNSLDNAR